MDQDPGVWVEQGVARWTARWEIHLMRRGRQARTRVHVCKKPFCITSARHQGGECGAGACCRARQIFRSFNPLTMLSRAEFALYTHRYREILGTPLDLILKRISRIIALICFTLLAIHSSFGGER